MSKKYYIAYGSNLNKEQMKFRCPDAIPEGTSEIENYTLVFRGHPYSAVATIEPKEGCSVPVAIWSISQSDEENLDVYEGFPRFYGKQIFNVSLNGKVIPAMVYIMTNGHQIGKPSVRYVRTIQQGYSDFGFDQNILLSYIISIEEIATTIKKIAEEQKDGNFEICPRCGKKTMREKLHYNCMSRRADVYVCEPCGMEEALLDFKGYDDLVTDWCLIRQYACCNEEKAIK